MNERHHPTHEDKYLTECCTSDLNPPDSNANGTLSGNRQVTQYMKDGWNTFSIEMEPIEQFGKFSPATNIAISLYAADADSLDVLYPITEIKIDSLGTYDENWLKAPLFNTEVSMLHHYKDMQKLENGEYEKKPNIAITNRPAELESSRLYGQKGIKVTRKFLTNLRGLPRWKWLDSDVIEDSEATREALLKEYHKIYNWCKSKDSVAMAPVAIEALLDLRKAHYIQVPTIKDATALAINEAKQGGDYFASVMEDAPNGVLAPWNPDNYMLRIYADGRLAELVEYVEGLGYLPPVRWSDDKIDFTTWFRFIFRRDNDKWIVTRQ